MSALVELHEVIKDYAGVRALDGVSLAIGGGITGLLGPNGAGKTTLIKVLLGLVRVAAGTGTVLGLPLRTQAQRIRAQVGYMPEDDCYIPGLSGVEMVQFVARLSGHDGREALRRGHEILDFCGVHQERYRDVATYSTGMRQKLKFALAIVHDPPLLILDEPTAGLDPEERVAMLNRIRGLCRSFGKAVILSTHILPDVQEICDTAVIMAGGRVQLVERLDVLSRPAEPAFRVRLIGDPAPYVAEVRRDGFAVLLGEQGCLTIAGMTDDQSFRVWDWATRAGVAIRSVTPARNSLEEVFLTAVRGVSHARA